MKMSEKKSNSIKQKPEHEVRCGAVTASIYLRQSNSGFPYFAYLLSRQWQVKASGKQTHGTSFFDQDEADLTQAVRQASEWIRTKNAEAVKGQQPEAEK
jgi:hypothetical protein